MNYGMLSNARTGRFLMRSVRDLARSASTFSWSDFAPVELHHQTVEPPAATDIGSDVNGDVRRHLPPIVICHGLLGNSGNWVGLARVMAEETGREVLLPDLRNHGRSPHDRGMTYGHLAADLRRFLSDRGVEEATLVGHSMGARTVMLLCLTDAARVRDAISIDATPIHPTPQHGVDTLQSYFRALKAIDLDTVCRNCATLSQARKAVDLELKKFDYLGSVTRQWMVLNVGNDDGAAVKFRWKINLDVLSEALPQDLLLVPLRDHWTPFEREFLFIGGGLSGYIPEDSHAAVRAAGFPRARFSYVQDAGHFVHIDQRERFLMTILPQLKIQEEKEQFTSLRDSFNVD